MGTVLSGRGMNQAPKTHKDAAQTVTGSWVNWGNEFEVDGADDGFLMGDITINNSEDVRIRVLAKTESGGTFEAPLPISVVSATKAEIDTTGYLEFSRDSNQSFIVSFEIMKGFPYAQAQIQAGTVGATGATLSGSKYSLSVRG